MRFSQAYVVLAVLPSALAASCTLSNAIQYTDDVVTGGSSNTPGSGSGSGSGSLQSQIDAAFLQCSSACNLSPSCLAKCLNTACGTYCTSQTSSNCRANCILDPCSAFYGSGSATPNQVELEACIKAKQQGQCNAVGGSACIRMKKRADLNCASNEKCYKEKNGNYFCLNVATGKSN